MEYVPRLKKKYNSEIVNNLKKDYKQSIDYIFLTVAFFAVLHIANNKRSSKLIKSLLIISWIGLLAVTINTTFFLFHISNELAYLPAFSLVALHLYNANLFSFLRKSKS